MAEKPSIAKAVAGHLSGGSFQTVCDIYVLLEAMALDRANRASRDQQTTNTSRTIHSVTTLGADGETVKSP